jgi:hypothetical protein
LIVAHPYVRGGADVAFKFGKYELLLGAYVRAGVRRYALGSGALPAEESDHCCPGLGTGLVEDRSVWIDRNELRLSLPVGFAATSEGRFAGRVPRAMFGVVPSFELAGYNGSSGCDGCARDVEVDVTSLENAFAVTVIFGLEFGAAP